MPPAALQTRGLCKDFRGFRAVDSVDLKGFYKGTVVDVEASPALYAMVAQAFPEAWIEDPDLSTPELRAALSDAHDRITELRHYPLISKRQEKLLAKRDAFERKAGKLVEYPRPARGNGL